MEETLGDKSDRRTWRCSYRHDLPAIYLSPVTALSVSCHSSFCVWHLCLTSSGAPREAGWWAHSCWIYGTNAAPLPTFLIGRGSMIHFLLGKHFHRKHLSNVSRGSGGVWDQSDRVCFSPPFPGKGCGVSPAHSHLLCLLSHLLSTSWGEGAEERS